MENKIITSSLINIDSNYRNINPKHIYDTSNNILENNPIIFTQKSNKVIINYNNHNFKEGDNIIIQNVSGKTKTLKNCIYLINNFNYAVINIVDHMIPNDYKQITNEELYINIKLYDKLNSENYYIDNIPFNTLIGIKQSLISSDINKNDNINKLINDLSDNNNSSDNILKYNLLFFKLDIPYNNNDNNPYKLINYTFIINYLHINGIKLGYLNANYPINNYNYQSHHTIYNILNNNQFEIILKYPSIIKSNDGGSNIQIYKIINTLTGYPNANSYTINLKKTFNNVINIELISTEIPFNDILIKKNINDKLYWKNIEDGDHIYSIQLDDGFYTSTNLFNIIKIKMNELKRIISTPLNIITNNFDINIENEINKITFEPFNLAKLPNSLLINLKIIDNNIYYVLTVHHPNNFVEINDNITISNSLNIIFLDDINKLNKQINSTYINKIHTVYSVNIQSQTYDIILGDINTINSKNMVDNLSRGGENITIKSKTKISLLFNKNDTIGDILGFKNIGNEYSITSFKSIITNNEIFSNTNNLDNVGNVLNYTRNFFNFSGNYNYILMYLNDIEIIYNNNNIPSAFAKILLSGNPSDILFNTFVIQPKNVYSKIYPILTLSEINVSFIFPDGTPVDFRNINHSFTLKITEEKIQTSDIYLNSKLIKY